MPNTHTIATHKIIVFIAFICAALMASLFVYRSSQKPPQQLLSPDVGVIFPTPRDIKSFELFTANNEKFTEKNFYRQWTLLFFGFTHCSDVCPTTLGIMNRVYTELHDKYPNLRVVLVSVDPERDTPASLADYTRNFNPAFIGVTGKLQEVHKLQSQLGVYSIRENSASPDDYQIQHTSSTMLIDPQGKWAALFQYGLKPDALAKGVVTSIESWQNHG